MRRDESDFLKNKYFSNFGNCRDYEKYYFVCLLFDCVYYCWQNEEITDEECFKLMSFLKKVKGVLQCL